MLGPFALSTHLLTSGQLLWQQGEARAASLARRCGPGCHFSSPLPLSAVFFSVECRLCPFDLQSRIPPFPVWSAGEPRSVTLEPRAQ